MAVNKKRDKKNLLNYIACTNAPPNFMKQRMMKKQQKFKPKEGVVDFMDNDDRKFQKTSKYKFKKPSKKLNDRTKKLLKRYHSDSESPRESPKHKKEESAEEELSEELGFGHELDQLILDQEYENEEEVVKQSHSEQRSDKHSEAPKPSISNAILQILGNDVENKDCPILSRNSRPFKLIERERKEEIEKKSKVVEKEKRHLQGRVLPSMETHDYEKNLQIIATKGVVRLFNAVSHQQTEIKRETIKSEQIQQELNLKKLEMDKSKTNSNDTIIKKILSREKKWKVFEDEEEEENEDKDKE